MNVMIIQPWIRVGGAECVSVQLAHELRMRGHKAPIVALFSELSGSPLETMDVEYILAPRGLGELCSRSRLFFVLFGWLLLLYLVFHHSYGMDVLNPHNFPSCWIAVLVGALRRIPVVWTCNEPPTRIPLKDVLSVGIADVLGWFIASSPIDHFAVRRVSAIHVLSEKTRLEVLERYNRDSRVIRSGVDFEFFSHGSAAEAKAKYDLTGKYVMLTVGKLHPQKNQVLCLEVLRQLSIDVPNAILLLVGEGPMRNKLQSLASTMGLSSRVRLLGQVPSWDLRNLYAACDIVLFPAINQSWGLIPFEALCARRLSVVSSDCGAVEILRRESIGLVAEPTPEEFYACIRMIRKDWETCRDMANKGFRYVAQNLDHHAFTSSFLRFLKEVVEKHHSRSVEKPAFSSRRGGS